ncbi:MAG: hypothetical protein EHM35_00635 [Planctomycetaceae bacterium]|nr:MAG: hypothetical protein EHM35_00635 [Planctomycetaceae bacterium]
MCQACVDEGRLSQATFDKIGAFLEKWPHAAYGPAHIVLDDDNLLDGHITWCLGLARAALSKNPADLRDADDVEMMDDLKWYADCDRDELTATVAFLEELLLIPEDER